MKAASTTAARLLPRPGLAFARMAERSDAGNEGGAAARTLWLRTVQAGLGAVGDLLLPGRVRQARLGTELERELRRARAALKRARAEARLQAQVAARAALRRHGLAAQALGPALALAADAAARRCAQAPYPTQLLAAATMLQGRFAEMATGEGKTLAMGLAAAVAGLAGTPVHVLTANDYLAARDEEQLRALFAELGLASGCIVAATPLAERAALYRRDIVYSTAREIGFDYLRDHVAQGGEGDPRRLRALALLAGERAEAGPVAPPGPTLPGLAFALLDEADSLLLDEATVPLLLARAGAAPDSALLQRAWDLAAELHEPAHYRRLPELRRAELTAEGRARLVDARAAQAAQEAQEAQEAQAAQPQRREHRLVDLVQSALAARLFYERDRDYVLGARGVQLIDEPTGRIAEGRRWHGDLYGFVQMKEGLAPEAGPVTAAQITYPRLFGRYQHLGGMSGTLLDAAAQLRVLYGARVARVPLARPDRRRWLGTRLFTSSRHGAVAVIAAVQREAAKGRPVLVGTDSVAASAALSEQLTQAGIEHQRLDALQDAGEAARIACAGSAGCVTVATNIAGRGTDIRLTEAARAAGGLHVIVTQLHRSRRIQRQLVGRAARHGDPGSAEALLALDDRLLAATWPRVLRAAAVACAWRGRVPWLIATPLLAGAQRLHEAADALRRWQLVRGEGRLDEALGFTGGGE